MKLTAISKGNQRIFIPAPGELSQRTKRGLAISTSNIAGVALIFVMSYLIGMAIYLAVLQ